MAITPQPQRQDEPAVTDADLDELLAGGAGAVPGLQPVADVLAALTVGATAGEMAGATRALAEFRRRTGAPVPHQRARRGTGMLRSRVSTKIGGAVAAVAVLVGGAATAAFADALPAPIQRLAHDAFGAPVPRPRHDVPRHGGPGAPGPTAAPGQAAAHGERAAHSTPRERRAGPHASPAPTAGKGKDGNPGGRGKHGNPQGKGKGHQDNGQGQQGKGKGKGKKGSEQGGSGNATARRANSRDRDGPRPARGPSAGGAPAPARTYQTGHGSLRPQGPSHAQGAVWRRRGGPGGRPS